MRGQSMTSYAQGNRRSRSRLQGSVTLCRCLHNSTTQQLNNSTHIAWGPLVRLIRPAGLLVEQYLRNVPEVSVFLQSSQCSGRFLQSSYFFYRRSTRTEMKLCIRTLVFALAALNVVILVSCEESFSCAGSSLCNGLSQGDCDAAKRQIQPGNRYFTGGNKGSTGVCSGHCGLFVSGTLCDLTGQEMIQAFDQLRDHNCAKCGIKTFNDGCQFKADYVTGC